MATATLSKTKHSELELTPFPNGLRILTIITVLGLLGTLYLGLFNVGTDVEQAVDACPVSCMHRVSFDELKNCETARDADASSHFEKRVGHIPVHVAGIDSDRNRRTSLYHTMKARCAMSSSCPQKGCFDCPSFRNKGENPYFIAKHKEAVHTRAQHFIRNGDANIFRKAVDL